MVTLQELQERVERGNKAKQLLDNPVFNEVVNELFALWGSQIFATDPKDDEGRRVIHSQHVALQTIMGVLAHRVAQGEEALELLEKEDF